MPTMTLSPSRADFDKLWRARTPPQADPPPGAAMGDAPSIPFVRFDPFTIATVTRCAAAVRAAAQSGTALAAGAVQAGGTRAGLLRAAAATGASIAAAAVNAATLDAAILAGSTVIRDGSTGGASPVDEASAGAFDAAAPSSPDDDAQVHAFAAANPDVALPALLQRVAAGDDRAAALVGTMAATMAAPMAAARAVIADAAGKADDALLALLRGRSLKVIPNVVALMGQIDEILPAGDGLKAFNMLYRMVSQGVGAAASWEDAAWIQRLDVLFADLYFDGVERYLTAPDSAPAAWRALMDKRRQAGIGGVQFALAGMSAHINRDLPVAIVHTWQALGPADHGRATPEFRDYGRVNAVLDATEPGAMRILATGLFQLVDNLLAPVDGWAAMAVVHAARDLAWSNAANLAGLGLDSDAALGYLAALDAVAADAGRAALVCVG